MTVGGNENARGRGARKRRKRIKSPRREETALNRSVPNEIPQIFASSANADAKLLY